MLNFHIFKSKRNNSVLRMILKNNIKLLITLFCLAFIGNSIYENFESLSDQTIYINEIIWLLFGVIFSILSIIINAYAWMLLINNIVCNSNKLNTVKLFIVTNIYKYLPGGIWHFVYRYNNLRLEFSAEESAESIILEPLLMLVAGLIFIPFGDFNILILILCWSSTLILLPGLRGFIIKKLKDMKANIFTNNDKLNNRTLISTDRRISEKITYPYKPLFVEILFILFRYFGFLCCIKAFSSGLLVSQFKLISSFSLAWIIGLVLPAAPGGLGIFEAVILFSLGSQIPEAPLITSLLFYRLVSMSSDILAALFFSIKRLLKILITR